MAVKLKVCGTIKLYKTISLPGLWSSVVEDTNLDGQVSEDVLSLTDRIPHRARASPKLQGLLDILIILFSYMIDLLYLRTLRKNNFPINLVSVHNLIKNNTEYPFLWIHINRYSYYRRQLNGVSTITLILWQNHELNSKGCKCET